MSLKVLLIEDSPTAAIHVQRMLADIQGEQFDADFESADRLSTGLESINRRGADVVLLDLSLPDSDGLDTFLQLKAEAPHIPIVVMSGYDDQSLAVTAVENGAQDYLVKGQIDGDLLKRCILQAVQSRQADGSLRLLSLGFLFHSFLDAMTKTFSVLGKTVDMRVPNIRVEDLGKAATALGGVDIKATMIRFSTGGQVSSNILLIFADEEARKLAGVLTDEELPADGSLGVMGMSALNELANMTVGAYINSLSQTLKGPVTQSTPEYACDMLGTIINSIFKSLPVNEGQVVIMETVLKIGEDSFFTNLVLILTADEVRDLVEVFEGVQGMNSSQN